MTGAYLTDKVVLVSNLPNSNITLLPTTDRCNAAGFVSYDQAAEYGVHYAKGWPAWRVESCSVGGAIEYYLSLNPTTKTYAKVLDSSLSSL